MVLPRPINDRDEEEIFRELVAASRQNGAEGQNEAENSLGNFARRPRKCQAASRELWRGKGIRIGLWTPGVDSVCWHFDFTHFLSLCQLALAQASANSFLQF